MTMKNRKTFAAVAAVLLAFCLVFMAPVGAEETGGPDMTGNVIEVNADNAQDVLDGKYGDITGKTIKFTKNIDTVLDLARPTKYQGSGTIYYNYVNSKVEESPTTWSENVNKTMNSHSHYYRTLKDVTFIAADGVTVAGFTFSAGHVASSGYDYVRDVEQTDGVTYYKYSSLDNITFEDLTITGRFDAKLYLEDASVEDITFEGCTFTGTTDDNVNAAIKFLADTQYFTNIVVTDCSIDGCYQGVYISGVDGATITGNTIKNTVHNAIALQSADARNPAKGNVVVNNNYIEGAKDRAIRMNYVGSDAEIEINNNVMVNSGDSNGELIAPVSIATGAKINLEYNYWDNKEVYKAVAGGLTAPTAVGITDGTWGTDVSSYVADGYYAWEGTYGTYHVTNEYYSINVGISQTAGSGTVTINGKSISNVGDKISISDVKAGDIINVAFIPADGSVYKGLELIKPDMLGFNTEETEFKMPESDVEFNVVFLSSEPVTPPVDDDTPELIEPDFAETITSEQTEDGVKVTIPSASNENVEALGSNGDRFIVTDPESGASMTITFKEAPTGDDSLSGIVESVNVNYVDETGTNDESDVTDITFDLIIYLPSPETELPTINPAFDEDKKQQIIDGNEGHTPLAMITATNVDSVNSNMNSLMLSFWIKKDEVGDMTGKEFVGYHIKGDDVTVITLSDGDIREVERGGDTCFEITLRGDSFSTWAVGIAPASDDESGDMPSVDDENPTAPPTQITTGGATDTGSGNYQYYPRDVPTNGIVDFGTSKVVTGIELPAGSSGKVTLNIKPDFTMPENGYYAFEIDAPGYNLDAKINGGLSFQIPAADLTAAGWTAKDIVLYHGTVAEDGTINWEALPTNLVKNENGIAYYKAAINGCSPFYIGFVKDGSVVNAEVVEPVTPPTETPDEPTEVLPPAADEPADEPTESPAPILAVLAGLGAAVVLRRK